MWLELLRGSAHSLRAHFMRVLLSSIGITWGIALLIVLSAHGTGYDIQFQREVRKIGQRLVYVNPGVVFKERLGERSARRPGFEADDIRNIRHVGSVEQAAPEVWAGLRIHRAAGRTKLIWTYGVSEATRSLRNFEVREGRFIQAHDVERAAQVLVLGAASARRLFGTRPAVGETVHVDSIPFLVVGVAAPKGNQLVRVGVRDDELAMIPFTTAQRWFTRSRKVDTLVFSPTAAKRSGEAIDQVRSALALHHDFPASNKKAIGFFDVQESAQVLVSLGRGLRFFLTAVGLVTLFVGAVGVMNVMFVVVSERRAEVGLRKSLGATEAAIFVQFLSEAMLITLGAGGIGVALGFGFVRLLEQTRSATGLLTPPPMTDLAAIAIQTSALIVAGILAGSLPAIRAARIDPTEALRHA